MIDEQLEREARALYDACWTVKPTWDQLGEITKSVWRERAEAQRRIQDNSDLF